MLDCEGVCNGTSVTATVIYPTTVARGCCPATRVDCDGVCAGLAKPDRCGICAGGRTGRTADTGLDCLGLCPGDPRRKWAGGNASCDPIVDVVPESIDFSVQHDAATALLMQAFPITVANKGPISMYLMDLTIRNHYEFPEKRTGRTLPFVEVRHNLTVADWGSGKVFEVPAQTTVEIIVEVDMRSSLVSTTSFNDIPLRNKGIAFDYSYSGPQAKQFEVFIPIDVSEKVLTVGEKLRRGGWARFWVCVCGGVERERESHGCACWLPPSPAATRALTFFPPSARVCSICSFSDLLTKSFCFPIYGTVPGQSDRLRGDHLDGTVRQCSGLHLLSRCANFF